MNIVNKERLSKLALDPSVQLCACGDHAELVTCGGIQLPMYNQTALVLSLFDGKRDVDTLKLLSMQMFNINEKKADVYIDSIIYRFNPFLVNEDNPGENPNCSIDSRLFIGKSDGYSLPDRYPAPIVMNYNITFNCNRQCVYCYLDAYHETRIETNALPKERFLDLINEAADIGVSKMVFIGGEPFLRDDLIELLELCSRRRIHTQVTTKACIDEEVMKRLGQLDFFEFYLSYDSSNPEICNRLANNPDLHAQMERTLRLAIENRVRVTLAPILCSLNVDGFIESMRHAIDLGVDSIYISRYFVSVGRHDDLLAVSQDTWKHIKEECKKTSEKIKFNDENSNPIRDEWSIEGEKFYAHNPIKCAQGRTDMTILPDGRTSYCGFLVKMDDYLVYGDLAKESILSAWSSTQLLRVINPQRDLYKGQPCYDCDTFDNCPYRMRCINRSYIEKQTFFAPSIEGAFYCDRYQQKQEGKVQ